MTLASGILLGMMAAWFSAPPEATLVASLLFLATLAGTLASLWHTDVRIMAATNTDLNEETRRGAFRSDVYHRLNVIALHLPPLRERRDDIPLLARRFLDSLAEREGEKILADEALEALCAYDWPGNVRELENALERASVVASGEEISSADLPDGVRDADPTPLVTEHSPSNPSMEVIERAYIQWVLTAEGGNKSKAAEVLGIDPSTLYRKLNRYGIED